MHIGVAAVELLDVDKSDSTVTSAAHAYGLDLFDSETVVSVGAALVFTGINIAADIHFEDYFMQ